MIRLFIKRVLIFTVNLYSCRLKGVNKILCDLVFLESIDVAIPVTWMNKATCFRNSYVSILEDGYFGLKNNLRKAEMVK